MNYGYGNSGGMWMFGGLMMLGMLVLVGVAIWVLLTVRRHQHPNVVPADADGPSTAAGRARVRQILDERFARGELTADDYAERLRTLGW